MNTEDVNTEDTLEFQQPDLIRSAKADEEFEAWLDSLPEVPDPVGTLCIETQHAVTKDRPDDWSHQPTQAKRVRAREERDTNELFFRSAHADELARRFKMRLREHSIYKISFWLFLMLIGLPFALSGQNATIPDDTEASHSLHNREYGDTDYTSKRKISNHIAYSDDSFSIRLSGCEENEKEHWSCKYDTPDGAEHWMYIPNFKPKHITKFKP